MTSLRKQPLHSPRGRLVASLSLAPLAPQVPPFPPPPLTLISASEFNQRSPSNVSVIPRLVNDT